MAKGNIIVVEACSTGYNYVADIIKRGYEPIVLESVVDEASKEFFKGYRESCYSMFPRKVTIIPAMEKYEDYLRTVKKYNPVLVIAGEENAVELATRLADDLGLVGNKYSNIDKYTKKNVMHSTLIEHGVRGIRGRVIHSMEEVDDFVKELGHENVVIKPTRGAGSTGVRLCSSLEEIKKNVADVMGKVNYFGTIISEVLLQERIFGNEYIVNTVSRNGKHRVTSIWKYDKVRTEEGAYIYNTTESVNKLEPGNTELIEYAYKVLDALDVVNGPVHGEYMIDKKGPVLIEVNCRPMGLSMPAEFLDLVTGQHETDSILDALLDPVGFEAKLSKPYTTLRKGMCKLFIAPKELTVAAEPVRVILNHMRSVYKTTVGKVNRLFRMHKTVDLETNVGVVYMVHDNPEVVRFESDFLHQAESRFFRMLFHGTGKKETPLSKNCLSVRDVMEMTSCRGSTLVFSDDPKCTTLDAMVLPVSSIDKALDGFDQVIIDFPEYGSGTKTEQSVENIFKAMEKVKNGGRLIVPERFYQMVPYGRAMIEELMIIGGFTVLAPVFGVHDVVCGMKNIDALKTMTV
ncbi:MAG: ATP-grasp domain-containing protein [Spirochaetales bacterium]|nr:ATP-grasp domain-containing protein [Spirochaetales bacterium]